MATNVVVLGAGGIMGFPIARNLARGGFAVSAWNRSREKAQPLADDGVSVAASPAEAAPGADVVITMLSDADAVLESARDALRVAGDGVVWVQMSTVGLDGTERCAALADEHGVTLVDAPVLGTKAPAEQGELIVMASGPESARERLDPLFEAIAKKVLWVGDAGAGTRLKLVTNSWIVTVVEGAAETVALAEGIGVDPHEFLEVVAGGRLDLPYLQTKGKTIVERYFDPSFRLARAA